MIAPHTSTLSESIVAAATVALVVFGLVLQLSGQL